MCELRSWKKSSFESVEGILAFIAEIAFVALASKMGKRNDYIGVVVDKVMIEIGEAEKFLNVCWPFGVQANLV